MSCQNYRVIEMQNDAIGAVSVGSLLPLGRVTRRISKSAGSGVPFEVSSSAADTVQLTAKGYYKVIYLASLTVGGAGAVTVTMLVNGEEVFSVTENAAGAGAVIIPLIKEIRVFANCGSCPTNCPAEVQFRLSGTAATAGTSNLIIDSCVNG